MKELSRNCVGIVGQFSILVENITFSLYHLRIVSIPISQSLDTAEILFLVNRFLELSFNRLDVINQTEETRVN